MKLTRIAIGAALFATSGAAAAQSAADARCILLSRFFANQTNDAKAQKLAEVSLYFYYGRINSQATAARMKTLFDEQAKTITGANAGALMQDCVKPVQATVQLLQGVSESQPKPPQPQGR